MTDKNKKGWVKFVPSLNLPKERVSIAYATHDERGYRFAYGYFQFYNGTCSCFWKDGNEQPKVVKAEDIKYWMSVPPLDVQEEPVNKLKIDDFTRALAECIHQAQCSVVDHLAHAEIWKKELLELAKSEEPVSEQNLSNVQSIGKNWKEPVSEDLEEASKEWLIPQLDKSYANYGEKKMMELTHFDGYAMLDAIEFGAKWKEQQFEKNRLKHCNSITNEQAELEQGFIDQHLEKNNRMPTFLDAIEYGMRLQKKQMVAKAIDGEVGYWNLRGLSVYVELPRSVNEGDKVKVIVIKEK